MKKVKLTVKEVLSIYTGVLFTENFEDLLKAIDKIYGKRKDSAEYISCFSKFQRNINKNRPEIRDVILSLGKIVSNEDTKESKENYAKSFENAMQTQFIEFEKVDLGDQMDRLLF